MRECRHGRADRSQCPFGCASDGPPPTDDLPLFTVRGDPTAAAPAAYELRTPTAGTSPLRCSVCGEPARDGEPMSQGATGDGGWYGAWHERCGPPRAGLRDAGHSVRVPLDDEHDDTRYEDGWDGRLD